MSFPIDSSKMSIPSFQQPLFTSSSPNKDAEEKIKIIKRRILSLKPPSIDSAAIENSSLKHIFNQAEKIRTLENLKTCCLKEDDRGALRCYQTLYKLIETSQKELAELPYLFQYIPQMTSLLFARDKYSEIIIIHKQALEYLYQQKHYENCLTLVSNLEHWADQLMNKPDMQKALEFYVLSKKYFEDCFYEELPQETLSSQYIRLLCKIGKIQQEQKDHVSSAKYICLARYHAEKEESIDAEEIEEQLMTLFVSFLSDKYNQTMKPLHQTDLTISYPWKYDRDQLKIIRSQMLEHSLTEKKGWEIQNETTKALIVLFKKLVDACMDILGAPPHATNVNLLGIKSSIPLEYAFLGLGSMSLGTMSFYSDVEFVILVNDSSPPIIDYFTRLVQLLEFKIILLGETSPDPKDRRYPKGFSFDDGGNTPLGKIQQGIFIRVPEGMASLVLPQGEGPADPILGQALCETSFLFGNRNLFNIYVQKVDEILDQPHPAYSKKSEGAVFTNRQIYCMKLFEEALQENFKPILGHQIDSLNIKDRFQRMLYFAFVIFLRYHKHEIDKALFNQKEEKRTLVTYLKVLMLLHVIPLQLGEEVLNFLSLVANIRNAAQFHYQKEYDRVYQDLSKNPKGFIINDPAIQDKLIDAYYAVLNPTYEALKSSEAKYKRP